MSGLKADQGKRRMDLLPVVPLQKIAEVIGFGAKKYKERDWEQGRDWNRDYGAALRHLTSWWEGQDNDPESGITHLAHAAACIVFLIEWEAKQLGRDTRPYKLKDENGQLKDAAVPGIPFVEEGGIYKMRDWITPVVLVPKGGDQKQAREAASIKLGSEDWHKVDYMTLQYYNERGIYEGPGDKNGRWDLVEKIGKV